MSFLNKLKDLVNDSWSKVAILFIFLGLIKLNLYLIIPSEKSAIYSLLEINIKYILLMFALVFFTAYSFALVVHELLKILTIEQKDDMRFSFIASLCLFIFLTLRNLMIMMNSEQFNFMIALIGLPFIPVLPLFFKKILLFNSKKTNVELVPPTNDNQKLENQEKYNPHRKYHRHG